MFISLLLRALLTCQAERRADLLAQGVAVIADRRDINMPLDDNRDGDSIDGSVMSPMLDAVRECKSHVWILLTRVL